MPELITCGQNNCVHHVRFGSCAAVRVSVACKGRGKHKTFCDSFVPVSYTHLDVYKRQLLYNPLIKKSIPFFMQVALFPCNLL